MLELLNGLGFSTEGAVSIIKWYFWFMESFNAFFPSHGGFALGWVERLQQPYYENGTFDKF